MRPLYHHVMAIKSCAALITPAGSNTLRSLAEAHNLAESLMQVSETLNSAGVL